MNTDATMDATAAFRHRGKVFALIAAPSGFLLANGAYAWMTRGGGDDLTPRGALAMSAAYPDLHRWAGLAAILGSLLIIPAGIALLELLRPRAARLGLVACSLLILGYLCYAMLVFASYTVDAMARHGGAIDDDVAVLNLRDNQGFTFWVGITFVIGNVFGTLLLAVAIYRAEAASRWAALGIAAWPILHFLAGPVGEVAGSLAQAIGLAIVARAYNRQAVSGTAGQLSPALATNPDPYASTTA